MKKKSELDQKAKALIAATIVAGVEAGNTGTGEHLMSPTEVVDYSLALTRRLLGKLHKLEGY